MEPRNPDDIATPELSAASIDPNCDLLGAVQDLLDDDRKELQNLETSFHESLARMREPQPEEVASLTFGERLSDKVAAFGGSWMFIIASVTVISIWVAANSAMRPAFDPFPFILLNLILSCIAALQAPIIMMSQNRQEAKNRNRAEHDFEVNRFAEFEIRRLHEKLDHLQYRQMQRLLEIQRLQMQVLAKHLSEATIEPEKP
jgi:uncharacterized membrane protein